MIRDYMVRYCKRMYKIKGLEWLDAILTNGIITKEECDKIL